MCTKTPGVFTEIIGVYTKMPGVSTETPGVYTGNLQLLCFKAFFKEYQSSRNDDFQKKDKSISLRRINKQTTSCV